MNTREKIVRWLKRQVKESRANGLIAGISGGIDSGVVAVLCKRAVGDNFLGLLMPCQNNKQDLEDAKSLAKKFKIRTKFIDLAEIYLSLIKHLPRAQRLAYANLKPRLRMIILYFFANKLNYLVVGTGNKSECLMGYFTKFGDGGVNLLPIANLLKRQVVQLAKELGIPEEIIEKSPSAGLWPGQTDEEEMGITYNELDGILERLENGTRQIAAKEKVEKVRKAIKISSHKRQLPEVFYP